MLMLASPVKRGIQLSVGYKLPGLDEVKRAAHEYQIDVDDGEEWFMVGSAWMFFYASGKHSNAPLRCYDRDYNEVYEGKTFEQILGEMWSLMNTSEG